MFQNTKAITKQKKQKETAEWKNIQYSYEHICGKYYIKKLAYKTKWRENSAIMGMRKHQESLSPPWQQLHWQNLSAVSILDVSSHQVVH